LYPSLLVIFAKLLHGSTHIASFFLKFFIRVPSLLPISKNSLGLNLMFHEIKILNHKSKSKEIVKITFKRKDLEFKLSFGVGGNYRNHVTMYKNKKNYFRFRPFFFGRSGTRKFIEKNDKKTNTISFQENDSFINLYSETVSIHSKNRKSRFRLMSKNLTDLEFISKQYKNIINH